MDFSQTEISKEKEGKREGKQVSVDVDNTSCCKCSANLCLSSTNLSISAAASWVDSTC